VSAKLFICLPQCRAPYQCPQPAACLPAGHRGFDTNYLDFNYYLCINFNILLMSMKQGIYRHPTRYIFELQVDTPGGQSRTFQICKLQCLTNRFQKYRQWRCFNYKTNYNIINIPLDHSKFIQNLDEKINASTQKLTTDPKWRGLVSTCVLRGFLVYRKDSVNKNVDSKQMHVVFGKL
jgi:hypothetical protein